MSILDLARPEIRAMQPYRAAQQVDDTVRLNANEAPWTQGAGRFRRPLNRYPEIRPRALGLRLAEYFGCQPDSLLVTRGSSEAIDLLIRAFCREGRDSVLITPPTFSMYEHYARVQGALQRRVVLSPAADFAFDVDAILDACDDDTRLIFLCSPNNPTGTVLPRPALLDLLTRRGERSAIVVDEAYVEFSGEPSAAELLHSHPNLVVLRTLSKAMAFAGARCGVAIGPPGVVQVLDAIQAPYALSTPVVECVEEALTPAGLQLAQAGIAAIVAERARLASALCEFPFVERVWPSAANFLLVQVRDGTRVVAHSRDCGVLLRDVGDSLADCIRITIGDAADNDRLLAVFAGFDEDTS